MEKNPFRNPLMPISMLLAASVSALASVYLLMEGYNEYVALFCPSMLVTGLVMKVHL